MSKMRASSKIINSRASYDYTFLEKFELGIVLIGSEVKSIREGRASLTNAHLSYNDPHIMIHNMFIAKYEKNTQKHRNLDETRARVMLVRKRERNKMIAACKMPGITMVPIELYWNKRGFAKILCAIAEGKTKYDKRESIKEKEWGRTKQKVLKQQYKNQ